MSKELDDILDKLYVIVGLQEEVFALCKKYINVFCKKHEFMLFEEDEIVSVTTKNKTYIKVIMPEPWNEESGFISGYKTEGESDMTRSYHDLCVLIEHIDSFSSQIYDSQTHTLTCK